MLNQLLVVSDVLDGRQYKFGCGAAIAMNLLT